MVGPYVFDNFYFRMKGGILHTVNDAQVHNKTSSHTWWGDMDYDMPHLIDIYIAVRLAGHHYMIDLIKEVV
jgi:hypothetical protein